MKRQLAEEQIQKANNVATNTRHTIGKEIYSVYAT